MINWIDLGLTYEQALHGMQSGVSFEMERPERQAATSLKHLRVGVNAAMVDHAALAYLLIEKRIIKKEDYIEALRLAMNNEVARYETPYPGINFR